MWVEFNHNQLLYESLCLIILIRITDIYCRLVRVMMGANHVYFWVVYTWLMMLMLVEISFLASQAIIQESLLCLLFSFCVFYFKIWMYQFLYIWKWHKVWIVGLSDWLIIHLINLSNPCLMILIYKSVFFMVHCVSDIPSDRGFPIHCYY